MGFELDTSGYVEGRPQGVRTKRFWWKDLDLFTRGYIEALFASLSVDLHAEWLDHVDPYRSPGFSDLAPETLAEIVEDCRVAHDKGLNRPEGKWLWLHRQDGLYEDFPPLTPYLDDTGKVRLRPSSLREG